MTTVSLRVKRLINERGLSQKELSILTGIRESTISEICRGSKTVINFDHIARIAEALNVRDIRELIELTVE